MKYALKFSILVVITLVLMGFLVKKGFLDLTSVFVSFGKNWPIVLLIALVQIVNVAFTGLRYFAILRAIGLNFKMKNVLSATYVGCGIGQWVPGSMAFIEIIRIVLMLGVSPKQAEKVVGQDGSDDGSKKILVMRSKLTAASFFDRLLGFFIMLSVGTFICIYILFSKSHFLITENKTLSFITLSYLLLTSCIIFLPFFANSKLCLFLFNRFEFAMLNFFKKTFIKDFIRKIFSEIDAILYAISHYGRNFKLFKLPLIFSFFSFILLALSIYLSGLVIGEEFPVLATFAIVSVFAITSILPISVGGLGAPQLIIAICFSSFGVSAKTAASSGLVNTGVTLFAVFFASLFFIKSSAKQIRQTLKIKIM